MTPASEFSHKVTVDPWPEDGLVVDLTATDAERDALRARFDLVDIASLRASARIDKRMMELVLAGTIEAVVSQACVVTLKPVAATLEVSFERHYRPRKAHEKMIAAGEAMAAEAIDEDEIDVDILEGGDIDIGEVIAEEFYLALDPYPRIADADRVLDEIRAKTGTAPEARPDNPFLKLRRH